MKIGIYFTSGTSAGGVYQYSLAMFESLVKIPRNDYVVFAAKGNVPKNIKNLKNVKVLENPVDKSTIFTKAINGASYLFTYVTLRILGARILAFIYRWIQRNNINRINKYNLDLMFYPTSSSLSFLSKTPSVVAVHDLMHRVRPDFPEVSARGRWENREFVYRNMARDAYKILVSSNIGKEDMENYYKVARNKIVVLPMLPPSYLEEKMSVKTATKLCRSLKIPKDYIFYPASFWNHKNHKNLILAMSKLKNKGIEINLVLTGSNNPDLSSFKKVMALVKEKGLGKQVFYKGYVDSRKMSAIYKNAKALVMPTYFGPTNIPILEAWKMGTPVIYSNVRGCRQQLGNAGLLIDPDSPEDIADKIMKIYTHSKLAAKLVKLGHARLASWDYSDFRKQVTKIINEFEKKKTKEKNKNRGLLRQPRA